MNICQSEGIPAGSVRDSKDLFADPQHIHRKHFIYMEHAEMGTYASDSSGLIMSETQPNYRPAPLLGEHTHKVITEMLGMSNEEFSFLLSEGVFD
jgi:crotonobetainyl-CoA:carnitine CoA-transferase CaiB-like acyl-CoA transferase